MMNMSIFLEHFRSIFARAGLELVDAIPQETHGGSMRYVLMKSGKGLISKELEMILQHELSLGLDKVEPYLEFGKRCEIRKLEFKALLVELKKQGKRVAGYAATSKSTTILNYSGVGKDLIEYISDSTPEKQGTVTPGTHIPVISHEQMRTNPPDYLILFAWNHEKEILAKETELTSKGLKWIRFVPRVEILN